MHSWRVLILPYIEEKDFSQEYDFSEPWNSPHNAALARRRPGVAEYFQCPVDPATGKNSTSYLAIVGKDTLWPGDRTLNRDELLTSGRKVLLVEVKNSGIHWMEPRDISYDDATQGLIASSPHGGCVHFVLADGFVGTLDNRGMTFRADDESFLRDWTRNWSYGVTHERDSATESESDWQE